MFLTWQEAYQTCLRSNAMSTLPAIPSEEAQRAFERYMTFLKLVDRDDFWMAGQEVRELEWKWINGKTELLAGIRLNGTLNPCHIIYYNAHHLVRRCICKYLYSTHPTFVKTRERYIQPQNHMSQLACIYEQMNVCMSIYV